MEKQITLSESNKKSRTDIDINPTFEYFQNKNPFRTS